MWDEELKILQTQEHQRTPLKVRDTKEKKKKKWLGECFTEEPTQHWKITWTGKSKQNISKPILHHPMMRCITQKTGSSFACFP